MPASSSRPRRCWANGSRTFYYRIDTGVWTDGAATADMSLDSNVAAVTLTVINGPPVFP